MNKDKIIKRTLSAAVALLGAAVTFYGAYGLVTLQAQEAPRQQQARSINGSISIKGGAKLDTTDCSAAKKVTSWLNGAGAPPTVVSRSGDFAKIVPVGASVTTAASLDFNSGAVPALWSVGGFTFNLDKSHVTLQANGFLNVTGTGKITGAGFAETDGTWRFSTQNPPANGIFSFSASTTATSPTPAP
jgi:hypothetical protein